MKSQRLRNILEQHVIWGWQGKYYILTFASYLVTFFYLLKILHFYPGIIALIMTMTGLLIILYQQIIAAEEYGSHKPNTFMRWIKSRPTNKSISISVSGAGSAVSSSRGHVTASISDDATIEKKVDFLLKQITALDSAIANINDRVDKTNSSLNKTKKELLESIDNLSSILKNLIASHVVGSYDKTLFGINITICGTVIQFFNL